MSNINYIMPEFYSDIKLNTTLLDLINKYPHIVKNNCKIYTFYGNFPNSIWNGGRFLMGLPSVTKDDIQEIFDIYNNYYHMPIRLTFTNPALIDERYCYDTLSNIIAECGHNGMNEILVASPILETYLRKQYPNYKYCRSIIAAKDQHYDITDKYFMSVLKRSDATNLQVLQTLPEDKRHKIEIICNDACTDDCPRIYEHYQAIGESVLDYKLTQKAKCTMPFDPFALYSMKQRKSYISANDIINTYNPLGYNYFKLCGREDKGKRVSNWLDYIIKDEYHNDIIAQIVNKGLI